MSTTYTKKFGKVKPLNCPMHYNKKVKRFLYKYFVKVMFEKVL